MLKMPLSVFTDDESFPYFIQYGRHEKDLFMHSHADFSELVIVTEGSAEHIVDNERFKIAKGDVFVISNDTEHGYEKTKNFRICNIMFTPKLWDGFDYDIVKTAGFQALFVLEPSYARQNRFKSRLRLNSEQYETVKRLCDRLSDEYSEKKDGWKTMFISGFLELVTMLSRLYSFSSLHSEDAVFSVAKAVSYIEKNFAENIPVSVLAKISNYSERQFIRIFKSTYGCNPTEYIRALRVKNACRLLKSTGLSVTEIASKCGYDDNNYFSRVFKAETGVSPSAYRNAL